MLHLVTRSDVSKLLFALSKIFQYEIDESQIAIWFTVLENVTTEELENAYKAYLRSGDNVFFPKPGQIYALAKGVVNLESEAALIAERIFEALCRHGADEIGTERAKNKIGEIGWRYIKILGGWNAFVTSVDDIDQVPTRKAQARNAIKGLLQHQRSGAPDRNQEKLEAKEAMSKLGIQMRMIK